MINSATLRPGLLVSCKTSHRGNVRYNKRTVEAERVDARGNAREKWETERIVSDKKELEAAKKAISKASYLVRSVCAHSAFGLLCPDTNEENLEKAIADARAITDSFNSTARLSRIAIYVVTGRIAADDVEAVRAINSEVRDLLEDMAVGIKSLDVKAVRDAANKARSIGQMLSPTAEARIKIAIDAARGVARDIVKAGEQAEIEIDKAALRRIKEQRTAFLDIGENDEEIRAPKARGRALDLERKPTAGRKATTVRALDRD